METSLFGVYVMESVLESLRVDLSTSDVRNVYRTRIYIESLFKRALLKKKNPLSNFAAKLSQMQIRDL